jgi:hypothetical protein
MKMKEIAVCVVCFDGEIPHERVTRSTEQKLTKRKMPNEEAQSFQSRLRKPTDKRRANRELFSRITNNFKP